MKFQKTLNAYISKLVLWHSSTSSTTVFIIVLEKILLYPSMIKSKYFVYLRPAIILENASLFF